MKPRTPLLLALSFASLASLFALGCGSHGDAPATTGGPGVAAEDAPLGPRGNPVFRALAALELRDAQRGEVDRVRELFEARTAGVRVAEAALRDKLASAIAAGKVEPADFAEELAAVSRASDASKPAFVDAVAQLHAVLDPAQRKALVDGLASRGEHGRGGGLGHGGLLRLAKDLDLTSDQRDALREKMKAAKGAGGHDDRARHREGLRALADAFVRDDFDAKTALAAPSMADLAGKRGEAMIRIAAAAVPILTPAQRTLAADRLRRAG